VIAAPDKPALTNLLGIYSLFAGLPVAEIEERYTGKGYGAFKTDLAEVVVEALTPFQQRFAELQAEPAIARNVLADGAARARAQAAAKMQIVQERMGLSQHRT
jgi:tryptophanyl-tRNA synthetase